MQERLWRQRNPTAEFLAGRGERHEMAAAPVPGAKRHASWMAARGRRRRRAGGAWWYQRRYRRLPA